MELLKDLIECVISLHTQIVTVQNKETAKLMLNDVSVAALLSHSVIHSEFRGTFYKCPFINEHDLRSLQSLHLSLIVSFSAIHHIWPQNASTNTHTQTKLLLSAAKKWPALRTEQCLVGEGNQRSLIRQDAHSSCLTFDPLRPVTGDCDTRIPLHTFVRKGRL